MESFKKRIKSVWDFVIFSRGRYVTLFHQKSQNCHRKGLTVLEILLSVAILALSAAVIAKVFFAANGLNERTKDHDEAVFAAVSIIESIDYDDLKDMGFDTVFECVNQDGKYFMYQQYQRKEDLDGHFKLSLGENDEINMLLKNDHYQYFKNLNRELVALIEITPLDTCYDVTIGVSKHGDEIYTLSRQYYYREAISEE